MSFIGYAQPTQQTQNPLLSTQNKRGAGITLSNSQLYTQPIIQNQSSQQQYYAQQPVSYQQLQGTQGSFVLPSQQQQQQQSNQFLSSSQIIYSQQPTTQYANYYQPSVINYGQQSNLSGSQILSYQPVQSSYATSQQLATSQALQNPLAQGSRLRFEPLEQQQPEEKPGYIAKQKTVVDYLQVEYITEYAPDPNNPGKYIQYERKVIHAPQGGHLYELDDDGQKINLTDQVVQPSQTTTQGTGTHLYNSQVLSYQQQQQQQYDQSKKVAHISLSPRTLSKQFEQLSLNETQNVQNQSTITQQLSTLPQSQQIVYLLPDGSQVLGVAGQPPQGYQIADSSQGQQLLSTFSGYQQQQPQVQQNFYYPQQVAQSSQQQLYQYVPQQYQQVVQGNQISQNLIGPQSESYYTQSGVLLQSQGQQALQQQQQQQTQKSVHQQQEEKVEYVYVDQYGQPVTQESLNQYTYVDQYGQPIQFGAQGGIAGQTVSTATTQLTTSQKPPQPQQQAVQQQQQQPPSQTQQSKAQQERVQYVYVDQYGQPVTQDSLKQYTYLDQNGQPIQFGQQNSGVVSAQTTTTQQKAVNQQQQQQQQQQQLPKQQKEQVQYVYVDQYGQPVTQESLKQYQYLDKNGNPLQFQGQQQSYITPQKAQ